MLKKLAATLLAAVALAAIPVGITAAGARGPSAAPPAPAAAAATPDPVPQTTTIKYGPYQTPAATSMTELGSFTAVRVSMRKPCAKCFITRVTPNLVYADGTIANIDTGPMLHHFVAANLGAKDTTCGSNGQGIGGQRFYSTGNERTPFVLPARYGYPVAAGDDWTLQVELMNHAETAKSVYLQLTYTYVADTANLVPVTPVWMDVAGCYAGSEYAIPAGRSTTTWEWTSTVTGRFVRLSGHLHDDGTSIRATDATTGRKLCESVARYGESAGYVDPMGMKSISSMSTCTGDPLARVAAGDRLRLASNYDASQARDDVMGIMIGYVAANAA